MAVLLYCVANPSASLNSQTGVAGSPVSTLEHSGLGIFYSENATADPWLRAPLRTSAEEFHRVQRELFSRGAIVPFRFPTILESENKLREHLGQRADEYKNLLQRFATSVQMDVFLTHATALSTNPSGAAYLRERQERNRALEQFAAKLRTHAEPLAKDWRQRSVSNGLRCFALLERKQVEEFNEKMKTLAVPSALNARISGPWPVAEFLDFET
jgi:gas vesicle protein GvpL/GvpF